MQREEVTLRRDSKSKPWKEEWRSGSVSGVERRVGRNREERWRRIERFLGRRVGRHFERRVGASGGASGGGGGRQLREFRDAGYWGVERRQEALRGLRR
eukprot:491075-Amorphochlora_amoeboformis.AAC.1